MFCKTTSNSGQRSQSQTVLRVFCRISTPWASFLSRTDSLRNVSPQKKALCPVWLQPAQNKERTSMFGSVKTERVCDCLLVSTEFLWLSFVCLTVSFHVLAAGPDDELLSVLVFFVAEYRLCSSLRWDERSTRSGHVLYTSRGRRLWQGYSCIRARRCVSAAQHRLMDTQLCTPAAHTATKPQQHGFSRRLSAIAVQHM